MKLEYATISLRGQEQINILKVIVAGRRDFNNYNLLSQKLDNLFSKTANVVIYFRDGKRC
jgi:hypothetical protein